MTVLRRISTKDAESIYGIPERTIRRWHAEGRMTDPEHDGHKLMWDADEIDQLARWRHDRTSLRNRTRVTDTPDNSVALSPQRSALVKVVS